MARMMIELVSQVNRAFSAAVLTSSNPGALPQAAGESRRRRGCENPRPSKFPNLFDLDLREPGARSFLSSDCNNLRGVISKLGVHVGVLTRQQINFSVLTFYPNRQPASDAVPRARSVFRTTRVVGDVTGEIEHFALHYDFSALDKPMRVALPQFHRTGGYAR